MKKRLLAALSAAVLMSAQTLYAAADWYDYGYDDYNDYGYENNYDYDYGNDYGYGYDYNDNDYGYYENDDYYEGYTENETYGSTSSEDDDVPLIDPFKDTPVTVKLVPTKIVDKKFSVDLYFETNNEIFSSDLTITYDSNVLKLNKSTVNKSVAKTIAAAETTPGTIQFQYSDPTAASSSSSSDESSDESSEANSSSKSDDNAIPVQAVGSSYLTLDFEVADVTERSSVLYITVNSLRDSNSTELTYRADGTIIQIEGAVPVDPAADESMYTELRVALSDTTISYESLGLNNVKQVTVSRSDIAAANENGINTLAYGLTNMTVEFTDGTIKYYRLVVSENVPAGVVLTSEPDGTADVAANSSADSGSEIIKTETTSSSRLKYLIIYFLVLIAIIAIFVEFFMFFGNPYKKAIAVLKKRSAEKAAMNAALERDMLEAEDNTEPNPVEDAEQYYEEEGEYEYSDSEGSDTDENSADYSDTQEEDDDAEQEDEDQ